MTKWKFVGGFEETKRNLLEVAVFWNEAGAVNPQQGGVLRHSAMQKSKPRTSSKKTLRALCGRRALSSAPLPPSAATSCPRPSPCKRVQVVMSTQGGHRISPLQEHNRSFFENDKRLENRACGYVHHDYVLCHCTLRGRAKLEGRNFRLSADVLLFWKKRFPFHTGCLEAIYWM